MEGQQTNNYVVAQQPGAYLRRLRAVGVTEAVGEEEARDSGEEAALIAIREEEEEVPSGADMSLFISSLLLRDTAQETADDDWMIASLTRWQE